MVSGACSRRRASSTARSMIRCAVSPILLDEISRSSTCTSASRLLRNQQDAGQSSRAVAGAFAQRETVQGQQFVTEKLLREIAPTGPNLAEVSLPGPRDAASACGPRAPARAPQLADAC